MPRIVRKRVIALPGSPRVQGFHAQPEAAGFITSWGFDGRAEDTGPCFDQERSVRHYSQDTVSSAHLLPGQIGCAVSHYRLLREFAQQPGPGDELMLVSEDDVRFSPSFRPILEKILRQEEGLELGLLCESDGSADATPFSSYSRRDMQLSLLARPVGPRRPFSHRFGVYGGRIWSTGLYLVSRDAARRITALATAEGRIWWLADDYQLFERQAGVRARALRPGVVDYAGESAIGYTDWRAGADEEQERSRPTLRERLALRTRLHRLGLVLAGTRKDLAGRRGRRPRARARSGS